MNITSVKFTNLGTINKNCVILTREDGKECEIYFSYRTLVAVDDWRTTTGKLLNELEVVINALNKFLRGE